MYCCSMQMRMKFVAEAYHDGLSRMHCQTADRHEVALKGLSQVEGLHIHWGEGQPCHRVAARPTLEPHAKMTVAGRLRYHTQQVWFGLSADELDCAACVCPW